MIPLTRGLVLVPVLLASVSAAATPGVVPLDSLTLNGWASLNNGYIRLTTDSNQSASAFIPTPFPFGPEDRFEAIFAYQASEELDQCAADGLAFVAQNTYIGPGYLGEKGSGLGFFTGIASPAIAVTFDYYANAITGTPPNAAAIATPAGTDLVWTTPGPDALSGLGAFRYVWVRYQNAARKMEVYYSAADVRPATPLLEATLPVDLSSLLRGQVYFGITAGTGSCYSRQTLVYLWLNVIHTP